MPPPPPDAIDVSVAVPLSSPVTDYIEFTGRTDAVYAVDVRARVNGYLVKVRFKDGQFVKTGDVLFEIDPRPYEAALARAKGDLARAKGEQTLGEVQVKRYTKLVKENAASQQSLDEWVGKLAASSGSVEAAKAEVLSAQLNLDFCTISSPIDGQVSRAFYQIGNLVAPDNTTLTTIVSVDPIYAYFSVDEPTYLRVINLVREGRIEGRNRAKIPVEMGLADDVAQVSPARGTRLRQQPGGQDHRDDQRARRVRQSVRPEEKRPAGAPARAVHPRSRSPGQAASWTADQRTGDRHGSGFQVRLHRR